MYLFRITESTSNKKFIVIGESIQEILEKAITKFSLPNTEEYQLLLEDGGFEIEEDEVLIQYADECKKNHKPPPTLIVVPRGINKALNLPVTGQASGVVLQELSENRQKAPSKQAIDLKTHVWDKLPQKMINACENGKRPSPEDRLAMVKFVGDYMIDVLQDTTRFTSGEIAKLICTKYPDSFLDVIDGQVLGKGLETLRAQIYNNVNYKKNTRPKRNKKRSAEESGVQDDDSDDDNQENEAVLRKKSREDEYGCVSYAPALQDNETEENQIEKRERLKIIFFHDDQDFEEIKKLMKETYPTQRAVINVPDRCLKKVFDDWPFFKDAQYIIQHGSELLGKNSLQIWQDCLETKAKPIRQFFKIKTNMKKKEETFLKIFKDVKEANVVNKNKIPKTIVIFYLLMTHFDEEYDGLFKIIPAEISNEQLLQGYAGVDHPILLIRGKSIYDIDAVCTCLIEKEIGITCADVLQGILTTFISYYVFGFSYPEKIRKTLEFIQRILLQINPDSGTKRLKGAKRISKTFDSSVYSLANKLNDFTNKFLI